MMRIAVLYSFLDNIGGSEIVALTLAKILKADLYTTNVDLAKIKKMGFADVVVKSIGTVPAQPPLRQQLTLRKFRRLNLKNEYDFFIIAGDWAVSSAVNNRPNLWYVHSMMKEVWDFSAVTKKNNVLWLLWPIFDLWVMLNQGMIRKFCRSVDSLVANSDVTRWRLKRFMNREAKVIYPPVDLSQYHYSQNGNFWLSVNRLIDHKRVEIQLAAFRGLPDEKLVIVGSYERAGHFTKYVKYLNRIKPKNVEIVSWVDQKRLLELYANCRGFITTSDNEDFGLTAVEAMASGKPVIAPNRGGYRESVIHGKCGILIDEMTPKSLIEAIISVNTKASDYQAACLERSRDFSLEQFASKIKQELGYTHENSIS